MENYIMNTTNLLIDKYDNLLAKAIYDYKYSFICGENNMVNRT